MAEDPGDVPAGSARNPQRAVGRGRGPALRRSLRESVTEAMIRADLAAGAPANRDGTIGLVPYAAWLAKETGRGD